MTITVMNRYSRGGPHSTVASYFAVKRRNDEAEETASSSEENICSSRVIVGSKHYFLQFVVHAMVSYRLF